MSALNNNTDEYMSYIPTTEEASDVQSSEHSLETEKVHLNKDEEQLIDQSYKCGLEYIDVPTNNLYNQFGEVKPLNNNNSINENNRPSNDSFKGEYTVTADGPELILDTTLNHTLLEEWPNMLAIGCQHLINEAKKLKGKDINHDFTIEISPVDRNCQEWKIFLRRDAVKCYQKYGKRNKKIQKKFIDYTRRILKEHKQDSAKELNSQKRWREIPTLYKCKEEFEASGKQCNFYVYEPYCIYQTKTYYAAARSTGERVITISPDTHESNEQWVQKRETWQIICDVIDKIQNDLKLDKLSVKRIYINFGQWQSQTKTNGLEPNDCHAHINLELTEDAIKACKGRTDKLGVLQDSIFAPIDYRLIDAVDLNRYIDVEIELELETDTGDYFNEEPYYSFQQLLSLGFKHYSSVEMHAKPSIISPLINRISKKQNKLLCDVYI